LYLRFARYDGRLGGSAGASAAASPSGRCLWRFGWDGGGLDAVEVFAARPRWVELTIEPQHLGFGVSEGFAELSVVVLEQPQTALQLLDLVRLSGLVPSLVCALPVGL
jgi:hypothetical protein